MVVGVASGAPLGQAPAHCPPTLPATDPLDDMAKRAAKKTNGGANLGFEATLWGMLISGSPNASALVTGRTARPVRSRRSQISTVTGTSPSPSDREDSPHKRPAEPSVTEGSDYQTPAPPPTIRPRCKPAPRTGLQPLLLWLTPWESRTVLRNEVRASSRSRLSLRIDNSDRRPSVAALP